VRVDVVGGLLCVLGLGGPVFALIEAPERGWSDPVILITLVGGIVFFALFLFLETRTAAPMLPLRLFHKRNFAFANLETLVVYAGLATLTFFLVLFLQQLAGYSPLQSGLATVPLTIVMFIASPRVGRLSIRLGPRFFMGVGPFVCASAVLWMRYELAPGFSYWTDLLPPLVVFACGLSLIVAPLTTTVLADAGEGDAGIASGVNNAVSRVAALIGIAVVGAAIAGSGNELQLSGFHTALAITAVLIATGGVIGLAGVRNPK
jgi:predicted MFS family arabinose efflux permease